MYRKFSLLLLFYYIIPIASAFYGDPNYPVTLPSVYSNAVVTIGRNIYMIGGQFLNSSTGNNDPILDVIILNFTSNGTLQANTITPANPTPCFPCQGYVLPDNETVAVIGTYYGEVGVGLGFYHTSNNSWTYSASTLNTSSLPVYRYAYSSAMSPTSDAIYFMGGSELTLNRSAPNVKPASFMKYSLTNTTSIINLTAAHSNLSMFAIGSCSNMLPNGNIVIAFGADLNQLYSSSQVVIFNTNTNQMYTQPVSGRPPVPRTLASSTLGPDKSTIYYYGGGDYNNSVSVFRGEIFNDIAILDTTTWSWVQITIPGKTPLPAINTGMTVYDSTKLVITPGLAGPFYLSSITGVLANLPGVGQSVQSSNLRWFTNYAPYDDDNWKKGLSDGAKAGIAIAVLVVVVLIITLLWKYVPRTKVVAAYIQNDIIWNPRSGEPLWAETSRLLVRFILLFLFLAFVAYVIYKSVNSPVVAQHIVAPTNAVLAPDIRFCFDGFNSTTNDPTATFDPLISCLFRNGTSCSEKLVHLNITKHRPVYTDYFGDVDCYLFKPGNDFYIVNDNLGYTDSTGTKMLFSFFAKPQNYTDISKGVIYVDFYPPGYNENTVVYGLENLTDTKLTLDDVVKWNINEQAFNLVESTILKQTVVSTASYTLTTVEELISSDSWNYFGFSSTYNTRLTVSSLYKDAPQNPLNFPTDPSLFPIAELTVQPSDFNLYTDKDQKVFTLLNAFAQAGGVLGLFIGVQTILFGFRPQSPWGVVHRWSFGKWRIKLTDRLANYFDRMGTPVPLVNPVSNRLSTVNGHAFNRDNNTYIPYGADVPSAQDQMDDNANQEDRVHRVEERLQLMELLLKSYYLNDEVFRSLDQAVKRGNQERRSSSLMNINDKDTDSVLRNNALNEEFELSGTYEGDSSGATDVKRRPSSTVFQQREIYQPRLAPDVPLEIYDEEHEIAKKS